MNQNTEKTYGGYATMGMCKPSGGVNKHGLKQKVENQYGHGKTRIEDEGKMGKENSRIDLYPDEEHQTLKDWIASRWYGPNGRVENDRDGTDHGFPIEHPDVPHDHPYKWIKGQYNRQKKPIKPDYDNYC